MVYNLRPRSRGANGPCPKTIAATFGITAKLVKAIWARQAWTNETKHLWTDEELLLMRGIDAAPDDALRKHDWGSRLSVCEKAPKLACRRIKWPAPVCDELQRFPPKQDAFTPAPQEFGDTELAFAVEAAAARAIGKMLECSALCPFTPLSVAEEKAQATV